MLEHLPKEVREGLEAARLREARKRARLRVEVGDAVFPVLRFWDTGFAIAAAMAPGRLRGFVDIHDGPRHILQCLIVASAVEDGELVCDFKRVTPIADRPALDYFRDEDAPTGYLPRA